MKSETGTEIMSESHENEILGKMEYILSREKADNRDAFSIEVFRKARDGSEHRALAHDVSDREDRATELFRIIAEGEVEPEVLYDVLYDMLP